MFLSHKKSLCMVILGLCLNAKLFALPTDSQQKLHIVADSTLVDYKSGTNTYEGKVELTQGSSKLKANRVITHNNTHHRIEEAIAYGIEELAEYTTLVKEGDPVFHAKAKVIKFYPAKSLVVLEGDADVTQGENTFHGPIVVYNIVSQIVTAPASKSGRATLIIDPDKLKS